MEYTKHLGLFVPSWTGLSITAFIFGILLSVSAIGTVFTPATPYSKFGNRANVDNIPSKKAMLLIYVPSVVACMIVQKPSLSLVSQFDLVHLLVTFHFAKRVFEVLFVHVYKSKTDLETAISVMAAYTLTTLLDLLVLKQIPNDMYSSKMTTYGVIFVVIGELVNGYHHILLRKVRLTRRVNKSGYSLPRGGFFDYCLTPHYLAEQSTFFGLILCSQNIVSLVLKFFPFIYLSIRSKKTQLWYSTHLTDKQDKADLLDRKNLIPFIW
ncbi:unnamed protein product [Mucor hiemalis]